MFAQFWLRQCRMVLRPHLYCLPLRFTLVRSLYWVLGLCGVSLGCCCVGAACTDDYRAGSSASLAQCCRCGGFFPQFRDFFGLVGDFCSFLGIFASIPWLRLWCSLFCSVCLFSAYLYPTVASLVYFSCRPPSLVVPVCVCVGFLSFCGGGAVSSSSPPAGCGVGSFVEPLLVWLLCLFLGHLWFSAACPAAGYPSRVPHLSGSG